MRKIQITVSTNSIELSPAQSRGDMSVLSGNTHYERKENGRKRISLQTGQPGTKQSNPNGVPYLGSGMHVSSTLGSPAAALHFPTCNDVVIWIGVGLSTHDTVAFYRGNRGGMPAKVQAVRQLPLWLPGA